MAEEGDRRSDPISEQLFENYIVRGGKVSTSSLMAASHLIAQRGHNTGFWKVVWKEWQKNNPRTEVGCVRILGQILEIDASARDAIAREQKGGPPSAWVPTIAFGAEVIDELIRRGEAATSPNVDHYLIALARSRLPQARVFFEKVLRGDGGKRFTRSEQFHAALGLAQLGQPAGYRWLIEHSEDPLVNVFNARPLRPARGSTEYVIATLQQLAENHTLRTKADWQQWLTKAEPTLLPVERS